MWGLFAVAGQLLGCDVIDQNLTGDGREHFHAFESDEIKATVWRILLAKAGHSLLRG